MIGDYVYPMQWSNDWISGADGHVHNPRSVVLDPEDVPRFDASRNNPSTGTFWREFRLDRVTLRFVAIPPGHDAMVERVAELLDAAASHTLDGFAPEGAPTTDETCRAMVALWFNRMAWHLRAEHTMPNTVHQLLMTRRWWHGADGIAPSRSVSNNRERTRE